MLLAFITKLKLFCLIVKLLLFFVFMTFSSLSILSLKSEWNPLVYYFSNDLIAFPESHVLVVNQMNTLIIVGKQNKSRKLKEWKFFCRKSFISFDPIQPNEGIRFIKFYKIPFDLIDPMNPIQKNHFIPLQFQSEWNQWMNQWTHTLLI